MAAFMIFEVVNMVMRCSWVNDEEIYIQYHDHEWGIPVYDDHKLFELLILEQFQAGLSWITILKKRQNFRKAFDSFDVEKISHYNDIKIEELMKNKGIIRNRRKIKASVVNAKVFIKIQEEYGSFSNYIWHFTQHKVLYLNGDVAPTTSKLSDEVSSDLKQRGMTFVGSTIMQSYLEAIGVMNHHEKNCFKHHKKIS